LREHGQVINASLTGPVLFTFVWFAVFGGAGLKMERAAVIDGCLGQCQTVADGVPFDAKYCKATSGRRQTWQGQADYDLQDQARVDLFLARRPNGCQDIKQLSMIPLDQMWFDVLSQYDNIGTFLIVISLIAMVLSVVTTNDSASMVLNTVGSNGRCFFLLKFFAQCVGAHG
jgi:choline-glycine betaine transporter